MPETIGADVLIKALVAKPKSNLDGTYVARFRQYSPHRQQAVGFGIADSHAVVDNGTHLAIKYFVRVGELFFQSGGDGDEFERRARFVDIADGAVFHRSQLHFPVRVRIEGGTVCQRKDFSAMRVLHNHGTRNCLGVVHGLVKFLFRNVLDVLVNGEDKILAHLGLLLDVGEPLLARVDREQPGSRLAPESGIICAFNTAKPRAVHAHFADYVGRQFALGIEALRFLLEMDSLEVEVPDALDG